MSSRIVTSLILLALLLMTFGCGPFQSCSEATKKFDEECSSWEYLGSGDVAGKIFTKIHDLCLNLRAARRKACQE